MEENKKGVYGQINFQFQISEEKACLSLPFKKDFFSLFIYYVYECLACVNLSVPQAYLGPWKPEESTKSPDLE